jgi:nicotinamide mononucleotide transporter
MNETLSIGGFATTPLELLSVVLSIATAVLNIRRNHWAWLFAIVSSAAYAVVFFGARLYGDCALQAVFIATSGWGWWTWLRGADGAPLAVSRLDRLGWTWSIGGWLAGFLLLWAFLARFTNTDVPGMDGFLTAGSLVGTALTARKKVENWHTWIAVDVLYVGLYVYKGLHLTALLYAGFVVLAIVGLRAWRTAARADAHAVSGAGMAEAMR